MGNLVGSPCFAPSRERNEEFAAASEKAYGAFMPVT